MRENPHKYRYFVVPVIFLIFASCHKITNPLTSLLTFDVAKSLEIPVLPATITGQDISAFTPVGVTNDDLVKEKTTESFVHTVKLTALKFTPDDISYHMTNFDSLLLSVTKDGGATELVLGTYSGKQDSVILSAADFVSYFKDSKLQFKTTLKLNTAPSHTVNIKTDYTFTFTADPL